MNFSNSNLQNTNSFEGINSNLVFNRNNEDNVENEISYSNIKLAFINEEDNNNNSNDSSFQAKNEGKENNEDIFGFERDNNSILDIDSNKYKNENNNEKKLEYLYYRLLNSYKNKKYQNIIIDIENKKGLFNKGSQMSFNIFLLKIRCLLQELKTSIIYFSKNKNEIYFNEISKKISKILKEFKLISEIIDINNKNEYEKITQIYSKYLLLVSIIYKIKEEYIKSFECLVIGVNSLKIFFIKQSSASDLKTYFIYSKLLLLLINFLIGDNNYSKALFYANINFKVLL